MRCPGIAIACLLWISGVSAQPGLPILEPRAKPPAARNDGPRAANIQVDSDLVLIPVSVTDIRDRMVLGLSREQFHLFDEQIEQPITHFALEDAPVSVAIVFDASGSMGPKLKKAREAVAEILHTANPEDEFALIQFNERVRRLAPLTTDPGEILNRLLTIQSKGQTALLDAIYLAVDTMRRARHARKAIIHLSDGGDNCSRYTTPEIKRIVREADVQIFAIGILEPVEKRARSPEELEGPDLLQEIASETGGRMYVVHKADGLAEVASLIGTTLRNQYLLGYSPSNVKRDGKYHRVQVRVEGLTGVRLFWRLGYYAPTKSWE